MDKNQQESGQIRGPYHGVGIPCCGAAMKEDWKGHGFATA